MTYSKKKNKTLEGELDRLTMDKDHLEYRMIRCQKCGGREKGDYEYMWDPPDEVFKQLKLRFDSLSQAVEGLERILRSRHKKMMEKSNRNRFKW